LAAEQYEVSECELWMATGHDRPDGHLRLRLNVAGQRALVLRAMGRFGAH
jgi:hypothetical protein